MSTNPQPQATAKETTDTTSIPGTQAAAKPTPQPTEPNLKNGDTQIADGKQQGYLLDFGWVDYMGETEVIYCDGVYENGSKVGVMD